MHKLSTVNNQDSSDKVVKALGVKCGGPWFECWLVLGCFFTILITLVVPMLHFLTITL